MIDTHDEILRLRADDDDNDDAADRAELTAATVTPGAERRTGTVIVTAGVSYASGSFYKIAETAIAGDEVEGGAGAESATGAVFFACFRGTTLPANGAKVVATFVPYRWVF